MKFRLLILLFAIPLVSFGQDIVYLKIDDETKVGSGFTIGRIRDTVFIVTAGHVPLSSEKNPPLVIGFIGEQEIVDMKVVKVFGKSDSKNDIALLSGVLKGSSVFRNSIDPATIGKDVFFMSSSRKTKVPKDEDGIIESWLDDDNDWFEIYLEGVGPGDSGSALFSLKGIVGMIISFSDYYVRAISIQYIKKIINDLNPAYWQIK